MYVALIVVLDIYSLYIKLFNLHYFSFLDHNLFAFMQLLLSLFGAHYTVYTYHCAMFIGYFSVFSVECPVFTVHLYTLHHSFTTPPPMYSPHQYSLSSSCTISRSRKLLRSSAWSLGKKTVCGQKRTDFSDPVSRCGSKVSLIMCLNTIILFSSADEGKF